VVSEGLRVICVKVIPQGFNECFEGDKIPVKRILEKIQEKIGESPGFIVLVNGKLVENPEYVVVEGSEVVIVQEFMGG
jgi:sulfur carrier protein ThiS